MNIQIGELTNRAALLPTPAEYFHIARSNFLDAFSGLEMSVFLALAASGIFKINEKKPFSQQVNALNDLLVSPSLSKERRVKVISKISQIASLSAIRADIVHSQMHVINIDGVMHAKIHNNRTALETNALVRLLTLQDFAHYTSGAKKLANELKQLVTPPSSQRPPLPGAATGL